MKSWMIVLAVLSLLLLTILPACGNEGEPAAPTTAATTGAATPTPTPAATTEAATPTPTPAGPVKIGAIASWSGPFAMAGILSNEGITVMETIVKERGGVLGGRSLKIVKYDDGSNVATVAAGWKKLVLEDNVSCIIFGGSLPAAITVSADAAEEYKTLLINVSGYPEDLTQRPYDIRINAPMEPTLEKDIDFILNQLKPHTIALLSTEDAEYHTRAEYLRPKLEAAGVKMVYEDYIQAGTTDISPFLTKIKYENPDVLLLSISEIDTNVGIFREIDKLGGWGNMKVFSLGQASTFGGVLKQPGIVGTYHWSLWVPGLSYPGAKQFEDDFVRILGKPATSLNIFAYTCIWTAIYAIELAGTDNPEAVAKAARSGDLQWDSPMGHMIIGTDGEPNITGVIVRADEGSVLTPVSFQ